MGPGRAGPWPYLQGVLADNDKNMGNSFSSSAVQELMATYQSLTVCFGAILLRNVQFMKLVHWNLEKC